MRIGGPRGPGGPRAPKKTDGPKKSSGADFKAKVEAAGAVDSIDPDEPQNAMVEAFRAIAEGLRDGEYEDRKGAIKQLVHAVIEERFKGLRGKGLESLEEKVADVIDKDPQMATKLADQFRRLAEGKK